MPGKHAPGSPSSFYLSVARAVLGSLAVLGVVVAVVMVLMNRGDEGKATATPKPSTAASTPTQHATPSLNPSVEASPSPSVSPSLRPRAKVTIVVLNGAGRQGLAAKAQAKLSKAGYDVIRIDNAKKPAAKTTIFFQDGAEADAQALLDRFPELGQVKPADASSDKKALITVVLGADYP